jgi:hypothetical protein
MRTTFRVAFAWALQGAFGTPVCLKEDNAVAGKTLLYSCRIAPEIGDFQSELLYVPRRGRMALLQGSQQRAMIDLETLTPDYVRDGIAVLGLTTLKSVCVVAKLVEHLQNQGVDIWLLR